MIGSTNFKDNFQECKKLQYNGQLKIQSKKGEEWTFYYRLGRIVWASGGIHPYRRWRRYMKQYCPNIDPEQLQFRYQDIGVDYWDYNILEILYKQDKITRETINLITQNCIEELLFDIAQEVNSDPISCDRNQDIILKAPMSFTNTDLSFRHLEDSCHKWSEAGLTNFSPNQAPILRKPQQLQQQVSNIVYQNIVKLMNGKYTLRDLALLMRQNLTSFTLSKEMNENYGLQDVALLTKQNLISFTRSLLPYILKGIIELVEVNDKPIQFQIIDKQLNTVNLSSNSPIVVCIDDSFLVCQILEQSLTKNGIRAISVNNPIQALPTIMEHKPDLIFLDLIMPVASGYEICAQLRRIPTFADTPVVILTGSDSIVDRVRAKLVGANEFLGKPIDEDKLIAIARKYLTNKLYQV